MVDFRSSKWQIVFLGFNSLLPQWIELLTHTQMNLVEPTQKYSCQRSHVQLELVITRPEQTPTQAESRPQLAKINLHLWRNFKVSKTRNQPQVFFAKNFFLTWIHLCMVGVLVSLQKSLLESCWCENTSNNQMISSSLQLRRGLLPTLHVKGGGTDPPGPDKGSKITLANPYFLWPNMVLKTKFGAPKSRSEYQVLISFHSLIHGHEVGPRIIPIFVQPFFFLPENSCVQFLMWSPQRHVLPVFPPGCVIAKAKRKDAWEDSLKRSEWEKCSGLIIGI